MPEYAGEQTDRGASFIADLRPQYKPKPPLPAILGGGKTQSDSAGIPSPGFILRFAENCCPIALPREQNPKVELLMETMSPPDHTFTLGLRDEIEKRHKEGDIAAAGRDYEWSWYGGPLPGEK